MSGRNNKQRVLLYFARSDFPNWVKIAPCQQKWKLPRTRQGIAAGNLAQCESVVARINYQFEAVTCREPFSSLLRVDRPT